LSVDKSYSSEEKMKILKGLKQECQSQKSLEEEMQQAAKNSVEAEASLANPIKEQLDAYNALKSELEKLCSKMMRESQRKVGTCIVSELGSQNFQKRMPF
jgi:hypothetical protein